MDGHEFKWLAERPTDGKHTPSGTGLFFEAAEYIAEVECVKPESRLGVLWVLVKVVPRGTSVQLSRSSVCGSAGGIRPLRYNPGRRWELISSAAFDPSGEARLVAGKSRRKSFEAAIGSVGDQGATG